MTRTKERRFFGADGQQTWSTFEPASTGDAPPAGFRTLERLNEQDLAPGKGFLWAPEKDAETLLYVREGILAQEHPSGRTYLLEAGECFRSGMPPGGRCRTFNRSSSDRAHVFECSFAPSRRNVRIRAEQKRFPVADRKGILRLVASPDGKDASLRIRQDVRIYSSILESGHHPVHPLAPGRGAWLHVVNGRIQMGDIVLLTGDGTGVVEETALSWTAREPSEILLFDLA